MKTRRKPQRWTPAMQAAALATKQAARDLAPEPDREDRRPTLCLFIGPESGDPLVNWRLIPRRGYVRQYRAVDAMSGDPVVIDGELIGGDGPEDPCECLCHGWPEDEDEYLG